MTRLMSHTKPQTHELRRNATEEPQWNGTCLFSLPNFRRQFQMTFVVCFCCFFFFLFFFFFFFFVFFNYCLERGLYVKLKD